MPTKPDNQPDDAPVVGDSPAEPAIDEKADFVAKTPIFIDGVRAYNPGDAVTADAVKNNKLEELVKKA